MMQTPEAEFVYVCKCGVAFCSPFELPFLPAQCEKCRDAIMERYSDLVLGKFDKPTPED